MLQAADILAGPILRGRTPDSVLHFWVSRVKRTGARLVSSGLTFDRTL